MGKVRSTLFIIAAIISGAPVFLPRVQPNVIPENNNTPVKNTKD